MEVFRKSGEVLALSEMMSGFPAIGANTALPISLLLCSFMRLCKILTPEFFGLVGRSKNIGDVEEGRGGGKKILFKIHAIRTISSSLR